MLLFTFADLPANTFLRSVELKLPIPPTDGTIEAIFAL